MKQAENLFDIIINADIDTPPGTPRAKGVKYGIKVPVMKGNKYELLREGGLIPITPDKKAYQKGVIDIFLGDVLIDHTDNDIYIFIDKKQKVSKI